MARGGRKTHVVTKETKQTVFEMAKLFFRDPDICAQLKITGVTLKKCYATQLIEGRLTAKHEIHRVAYAMATSGKHPTVTLKLLEKTGMHEVKTDQPIEKVFAVVPKTLGTTDPVEAAKIYQQIMSG